MRTPHFPYALFMPYDPPPLELLSSSSSLCPTHTHLLSSFNNAWPLHWCIVALCSRHAFVILRPTTWCTSNKSMPSICWRTSYGMTFVPLPSIIIRLNWYLDVPLPLRLSFTVRFIRLPFDYCSSKLVSSPLLSHIIRKYPRRIFVLWIKLVIAVCPYHYASHQTPDGDSNPMQTPPE